ncbi:hypothetical protein CHARACLAT_022804 [Characodon lateralis]|uniref:Uncharacterized protein n=1 Tax=Characodon lateralis TaxID=208331 RepID=A0ABU7EC07_9TELE|nr:hypothetical protein [Characodon lateralis]
MESFRKTSIICIQETSEWQCSDSEVPNLICAHTHTHTQSNSAILQASLRLESIVWVEISSNHPAPSEGGLPWALWMTLKGFVREDPTLLLLIMLWQKTTERSERKVWLTTCNQVYLNNISKLICFI